MDYYKSMNKLLNLFGEYINKVPHLENHLFVLMIKIISKLIKSLKIKNYNTYGINQKIKFSYK